MQVPLLDLKLQYAPLKTQILAEIEEVADSQALILGPKTEQFETGRRRNTAARRHAIGVSSGTDAQLVLLMALGIGPGDKVITTPYTFFATAVASRGSARRPSSSISIPATYNIDPAKLAEALNQTANVKAIIPVHLYGQCADMAAIVDLGKSTAFPCSKMPPRRSARSIPLGARRRDRRSRLVFLLPDEKSRRIRRRRDGRLPRRRARREDQGAAQSRHGAALLSPDGSAAISASMPSSPPC